MSFVSTALRILERDAESFRWRRREIEEAPEDPIAWNGLATWYLYHPHRDATAEELDEGLRYSAVAVEKARASNTWRRNVLHDRCRIAVAAGRFDVVEDAMAEILSVWADPCEPDIPMFEWDWLTKVPPDAIDAGLRSHYQAVVAEVLARRAERERTGSGDDPAGPAD